MKTVHLTVVALCLLSAVSTAEAALVEADFVIALDDSVPCLGDHFDNGVLDSPPWYIAGGSPGPETGTTLAMDVGDKIVTSLWVDPLTTIEAQAEFLLTDFPADTSAALWLYGETAGDALAIAVVNEGALFYDETGVLALYAFDPFDPDPRVNLDIVVEPDGTVIGSVNGITFFNEINVFTPCTGMGLSVMPEPGSLALLAVGFVFTGRRGQRKAYHG